MPVDPEAWSRALCVVWIAASITLSVSNKALMQAGLDPVFVVSMQMSVTAVGGIVAMLLHPGRLQLRPHLRWMLTVTPFFVCSLLLWMQIYRRLSLSTIVLLQNVRLVVVFVSEWTVFEVRITWVQAAALVTLIAAGGMYGSASTLDSENIYLVTSSIFAWSMDLIIAQYHLKFAGTSSGLLNVGIASANNLPGVPIMAVVMSRGRVEWPSLASGTVLLLSCGVGLVMSTTTAAVQRRVSALAFSTLGVLAKTALAIVGVVVFADSRSALAVGGVCISLAASVAFLAHVRPRKPPEDFEIVGSVFGRRLLLLVGTWIGILCFGVVPLVWGLNAYRNQVAIGGLHQAANVTRCHAGSQEVVPRILHATGRAAVAGPHTMFAASAPVTAGPAFELRYANDTLARAAIAALCGEHYALAFDCLLPGAFRADMYRMCVMHAVGGVYMDDDIVPLRPLDEVFSLCQPVTVAWDRETFTWWGTKDHDQLQQAMIAAAPGHPLFRCHMDAILRHVRERLVPAHATAITGPIVFHDCYEAVSHDDVAIDLVDLGSPLNVFAHTAIDSYFAAAVAYQFRRPRASRDYVSMVKAGHIYADVCEL
tara:strand:+ start:195 stop:1976 length:1782 start_codon:yes stop_codon:yes gene_type:complete